MQSPTITNNTTVNSIVDLVKLKLSPCMKAIDLVTMRMTEAIEHGSQAYCLANDLSDIDIFICVLCIASSYYYASFIGIRYTLNGDEDN